jgi:hypothetical protein
MHDMVTITERRSTEHILIGIGPNEDSNKGNNVKFITQVAQYRESSLPKTSSSCTQAMSLRDAKDIEMFYLAHFIGF